MEPANCRGVGTAPCDPGMGGRDDAFVQLLESSVRLRDWFAARRRTNEWSGSGWAVATADHTHSVAGDAR